MNNHQTRFGDVPLHIGGEAYPSASEQWIEVTDPADQSLLARVPKATSAEIELAVRTAHNAYLLWREVPASERARVMFNYQHLLKTHHDELAALLAQETGKNLADAKGMCGAASRWWSRPAPSPVKPWGDHGQRGAAGRRSLLGAAARGLPWHHSFQLSGHDPLWMFPLAVACGNGFVLKPSEQDPLTPCGWPSCLPRQGPQGDSVGGARRRRAGGCAAGPSRHQGGQFRRLGPGWRSRLSQRHFPAQAGPVLCRGQEPHGDHAGCQQGAGAEQPGGAGVGAAGQRCMAISVAVFVGSAREWIPELAAEFAKVKPGVWHDPEAAYGPLSARRRKSGWRGSSRRGSPRAPSACWTVVLRRARLPGGQLGGADPVSRRDAGDAHLQGGDLRARAGLSRGGEPRRGARPRQRQPLRQRYLHLHRLRRCCPQVSSRGGGGPGGDQRAHPGAAAVFSFTGWRGSFYGDLHAYGKQAVRFIPRPRRSPNAGSTKTFPAAPT